MPEFLRMLSELREHMQAELTRSDILRALIWPNAGLLIALTAALAGHPPEWVLTTIVRLLVGFLLLYAATYIFCLFADRDALRSEKYKLQKIAIERGLFGDDKTGLFEALPPDKGTGKSAQLPKPEAEQ